MTTILKEIDYGTPASESTEDVTIEIDGIKTNVKKDTSVLRAAKEVGISIPKLCATDSIEAFGSCRLCMVEIEGKKGFAASCHTPVFEGMKVKTQSDSLFKLRRGVMELYISDHPLDCLTCSANGDCELQDMAGQVGLRAVDYGFDGKNHLLNEQDQSNPYFTFDSSKCILCSRCVRACDEVQGTFALTVQGRGFDSKITPGFKDNFLNSECVSCGACVQACPTSSLMEKSVIDFGLGERTVLTTCAYCGVGCSFKVELSGNQVKRMVPYKDGKANEGHSCVKGRFAWTYANSKERVVNPLVRDSIDQPWREATWEEAITKVATEFKSIQSNYGRKAISGITSSRCTNEEVFLMQKLIRAGFGNNNVDTCARVCHSPTGYGLKSTIGTSAGTQSFRSVKHADVIMVIGANPTDAHPVFASRMKKRLREGAKLIVIDPRKIDLVKSAHVEADHFLQLLPGTNVAIINALAHTILKENLADQDYVQQRCNLEDFKYWTEFILEEKNSPEMVERYSGVPAEDIKQAARLYAQGPNSAIYYGLGVTEHSQGSTTVMSLANLAMLTGNIGREGVGINPLRGQNNVQGSCDMGSFPHEFPGYRHVSDDQTKAILEKEWQVKLDDKPGMRIPNMFDAAISNQLKGIVVQGEDIAQSDPNLEHVQSALKSMDMVVVIDIFLNETSKYAHVILPGSTFLEKTGTFTNAERRLNMVNQVMEPKAGKDEWQVICDLSQAMGYAMHYNHPSEIMDEIARTTPSFSGVSHKLLNEKGGIQWPCNEQAPSGTETMHVGEFVIGKGKFLLTDYVPTHEHSSNDFPLLLTTGRILSQYNVGAQTRKTKNNIWHSEDILEINPDDAQARNIKDGDLVLIKSRIGATTLKAKITQKIQKGVVYTTFHHPETGANIITTEYSDWATNCPEYKVTAVQIALTADKTDWQRSFTDANQSKKEKASVHEV